LKESKREQEVKRFRINVVDSLWGFDFVVIVVLKD